MIGSSYNPLKASALHARAGKREPVRLVVFLVVAFAVSWTASFTANSLLQDWVATGDSAWRQYVPTAATTWSIGLVALVFWHYSASSRDLRTPWGPVPGGPRLVGLLLAPLSLTWLAYASVGVALPLTRASVTALAAHLLAQFALIGIAEELGWRGVLLRRLADNRALVSATLLTTVAWLLWHLPKLLSPIEISGPLAVLIVSSSILISLVWAATGGSVVAAGLLHAAINAPVYWLEFSGAVPQRDLLAGWRNLSIIYATIALLSLVLWRRTWLRVVTRPEQGE